MAYKIRIVKTCREEGCDKTAQWEVYNRTNGQIGFFCTQHANARIRGLEMYEKAEDNAQKQLRIT